MELKSRHNHRYITISIGALIAVVLVAIGIGITLFQSKRLSDLSNEKELAILVAKDKTFVDSKKIEGGTIKYGTYLVAETSESKYVFLKYIDGVIKDGKIVSGYITLPNGELTSVNDNLVIPNVILKNGNVVDVTIISKMISFISLPDGDTLAIEINNGEFRSGIFENVFGGKILASGNILAAKTRNSTIEKGFVSESSTYVTDKLRTLAQVLEHELNADEQNANSVLGVNSEENVNNSNFVVAGRAVIKDHSTGFYTIVGGLDTTIDLKGILTSPTSVVNGLTIVTSREIKNSTILGEDIANNTIDGSKILNDSILNEDIASNAVNSTKIEDNTISTSDLSQSLEFSSGDLLDLSSISHTSSAPQGLILPNVSNSPLNPDSREGYIAYNASSNEVIYYNGSSWNSIGGSNIDSIVAGSGLSGGGSSGDVSLSILLTTSGGTGLTSSNSGLEVASTGLSLLKGCADGQILEYTDAGGWACGDDNTGSGGGSNIVEEGDVTVDASITNFDFSASDFTISESPEDEANISIDYANSGITRGGQDETVTGNWSFPNLTITGNLTINDSGSDTILIGQNGATDDVVAIAGNISLTDDDWSISASGVATGITGITADSVAFSGIISGTNTNALVIGNGGSLASSGTGTITATDLVCTNCIGSTEISGLTWAEISSTPTTLSGYGISDALSNSSSSTQDGRFGDIYLRDDTTPSHYLQITNAENLTGVHTLSLSVGDTDRSLTLSGNATISGTHSGTSSGTNTGDQTITLTGDVTGSGTGSFATTIVSDSVALGTDTTGNYVESITNGSGISGADGGSEGAALTLSLGNLTSDWTQSGAFDVILGNADSQFQILESSGGTYYGTFDVGDLSANSTYTFSGTSGTVLTTSNVGAALSNWDQDSSNDLTTSSYAATLDSIYVNTSENPTSGDISGSFTAGFTIGNNSVALGTDTTGDYVSGATSNGGLTLTGTEGGTLGILLPSATNALSSTTSSGSGLELTSTGVSLLQGCSDGQILKWNETADTWGCGNDSSGAGSVEGQEGGSQVVAAISAINFASNDFIVTDNGSSVLGVAVDFTNITGTATGLTAGDLSCTNCIGATEIADLTLGTDTGGNYVATIAAGNGISGSSSTEGGAPTIALGDLTGDWSQSGAFDIVLSSASSEIKIKESSGDTYFGVLEVGDLASADATYTFSGVSGTVLTTSNVAASLSGWDQDSSNDLTTSTSFTGDVSGNYNGLSLGSNTIDDAELVDSLSYTGSFSVGDLTVSDTSVLLSGSSFALAFNAAASRTVTITNSDGSNVANLSVEGTIAASNFSGSSSGTNTGDQTITLTGDVTGTGTGSFAATIALDSVALGTDTTGDYVSGATSNGGLTLTGTEGATLGILLPSATNGLSATTSSGSGLELTSSGVSLLQGCSDGQILKWNETADTWGCSADSSGSGSAAVQEGSSEIVAAVAAFNFAASDFVITDAGSSIAGIALDYSNFSGTATGLTAGDLSCTNCIGATEISDLTLGTDTTGNYVASITNGNGITGGDGGSESAGLTLAVDATYAFNWTGLQTHTNSIANSGSQSIFNLTLLNDADVDTVSAITISATSASTGDADNLYGLDVADLSGADGTVVESAIHLGTGWDYDIQFTDSTGVIKTAANSTLTVGDSGQDILTLDFSNNYLRFGDGTNGITFDVDQATAIFAGSARPATKVTLVPEYEGAVLTGDGGSNLGTMTSDFCSEDGLRNVNSNSTPTNSQPCDNDVSGEEHNYYTWTSTSASQDYDIWVRWQVPDNFAAFAASNAVQVYGWRTDATNVVEVSMFDTAGSSEAADVNVATGTSAWTLTTVDTSPSGTYTQGSYLTFKIHMANDTANDHVKVGEIIINYLARR